MRKLIFLKYFGRIALSTYITSVLVILNFGCTDRSNPPRTLDDSTIVHQSKHITGSLPKITLSNKISKKTGKPLKPGRVFKLQDDAKIFASVELEKQTKDNPQALMFHIDWIDSAGNSFYKKRIDISPDDSLESITSSISISPQKRKTGNYSVRLYLFRVLIAEKKFQLVKSMTDSAIVKKKSKSEIKNKPEKKVKVKKTIKPKVKIENIKASIILCRKISKKTGKPIGTDTTFTIKDSANVKAVVSVEKQDIKTNEQLKFYFDWIGPDGKSFYKKSVVYTTSNPLFTISNSISITPEKRQPGTYTLQVIFRKKIIAEQKFELTVQGKPDSLDSRN